MPTSGAQLYFYTELRNLLNPAALPSFQDKKPECERERECYLCLARFKPESKYSRFCERCKKESEEYRFSDTYSLMAG